MRKKDYGQYMTPQDTADWMAEWFSDKHLEKILEPSCGDGAFIRAVYGAIPIRETKLLACELDDKLFLHSLQLLRTNYAQREYDITNCCFLEYYLAAITFQVDAIIGNPPYISHLTETSDWKNRAKRVCAMNGIQYSKMMNTWMLFTLASLMMLKKNGGYFAFILPSDIITAPWAEAVRRKFWKDRFHVAIIETAQPIFPDVQQSVCIVLAQKGMDSHKVRYISLNSLKDATASELWELPKRDVGTRWNLAQISEQAQELVTGLGKDRSIRKLCSLATIKVPPPTGANKFFFVNHTTIEKYGLTPWCHPVLAYAKQCKSILYETHDWQTDADSNAPVYLLMLPPEAAQVPSWKPAAYLAKYRACNPKLPYKVAQHTPEWWCLPKEFTKPECFLLKRCGNVARLIRNWADVIVGDCAIKVEPHQGINPDVLTLNFMNPLTMLTAELYGKKFGGGVLELSPRAADELLIPWPEKATGASLHDISVLHTPEEIACKHGYLLLHKMLAPEEIKIIVDAWQTMRTRRIKSMEVQK